MAMLRAAMDRAGISSFDQLGEELRSRYREFESLKSRSIGAKLSLLDQGKTDWWIKRPEHTKRLTEVLGCAHEDLGLHFSKIESRLYAFEEFPELPPLQLDKEGGCDIGYFTDGKDGNVEEDVKVWFGQSSNSHFMRSLHSGVTWLHFPHGTGRDVFFERLSAISPYECKSAITVSSIKERLKLQKPLCLNVTDSAGQRDLDVLAGRNKDCAILICAPFEFPEKPTPALLDLSWTYQEDTKEGRNKRVLTDPNATDDEGGVNRYTWHLHPDWHERLLRWVESRLTSHGDSLFDAEGLLRWIKGFPEELLFDTPRSLIAICRFTHHYGHKSLPAPDNRNTGEELLKLLRDEQPLEVRRAFVEMTQDWLKTTEYEWGGWLDGSRWGWDRSHLWEQLEKEGDAEKRALVVQKLRNQECEKNRETLKDSYFLVQNVDGRERLNPRFLADLVARDWICSLILESPHAKWGGLCFDLQRRALVRQAFDLLTIEEITECAKKVVSSYREDAPGIGATEAIFCAIGRRSLKPNQIDDSLKEIADIIIRRLLNSKCTTPIPWSIGHEEDSWWMSCCWTWSFALPKPEYQLHPNWNIYFPGWCGQPESLKLDNVAIFPDDNTPYERLSAAQRYLLLKGKDVARMVPEKPSGASDAFIPHLMVRAIEKEWEIPSEWWQQSVKKRWVQDLFLSEMESIEFDPTEWTCKLISAIRDISIEDKYFWVICLRSRVWRFFLERTEAKLLIARLDEKGLEFVWGFFPSFPLAFQAEILNRFRHHNESRDRFYDVMGNLTDEHIDSVVSWLEVENIVTWSLVGRWLWANKPERAESLLRGRLATKLKKRLVLTYDSRNSNALGTLIDLIKTVPAILTTEEVRSFVHSNLPNSGGYASQLLELIRAE